MSETKRRFLTREIQLSTGTDGDFSLKSKGRLGRFWDTLHKFFFKNITPVKKVLFWYTFFAIGGALLLWTQAAQNIGSVYETGVIKRIDFIDALFMSSSAFSDTGLGTVVIAEQFNIFGQIILFFQILIGGIGWFTIKLFVLSFIISRGLSWRNKRSLSAENGASIKVAVGTAKVAAYTTITMILLFGSILGVMFHFIPPSTDVGMSQQISGNAGTSIWTGFFMANSSINNAGLDIIGSSSLAPYYGVHSFQWIMMFLFILGGMGFGILYDVKEWALNKHRGKKFRFSLLTKVSTITYLSVALFGVGLAFMFEGISYSQNGVNSFFGANYVQGSSPGNPFTDVDYGTASDKIMAIFFNSMSTRNAGFSTIDLNVLSTGTITTYNLMMFIGSGPGSTAGGIRTTTLFVMISAMVQITRGKRDTSAFKRRLPKRDVREAFVLTTVSITLIIISTMIIISAENGNAVHDKWIYVENINGVGSDNWLKVKTDASFVDHLFTVFSAYGTTGLSTISLSELTSVSKTTLIILMFIGQLGVLNFLKSFTNTENRISKDTRRMITESIAIG